MRAGTATDATPRRGAGARLAILATLLTFAVPALAPTPATAMDDKGGTGSGSECQATYLPFIGLVYMDDKGFCDPKDGSSGGGESGGSDTGSGGESEGGSGGGQAGGGEPDCDPEGQPTVGEIYCAHSTPQAKTDPPQPRRDGCYFGCLRKGGNPVTGRDHNGFPGDRPGRGSAGKTNKEKRRDPSEPQNRQNPTKQECRYFKDRLVLSPAMQWQLEAIRELEKDEEGRYRNALAPHLEELEGVLMPERRKLTRQLEKLEAAPGSIEDKAEGIAELYRKLSAVATRIRGETDVVEIIRDVHERFEKASGNSQDIARIEAEGRKASEELAKTCRGLHGSGF
jgi:hypothetical protein